MRYDTCVDEENTLGIRIRRTVLIFFVMGLVYYILSLVIIF